MSTQLPYNTIITGDSLAELKKLPDECIQCTVTSPPYWGLRDYGVKGQLGLEKSPAEYIERMREIFREVYRITKKNGVLWLNIGDSYSSGPRNRTKEQSVKKTTLLGSTKSQEQSLKQISKYAAGVKPKDLIGIPWMLAFALREDGWYLRQDIIWHKPNPMPESVTDRCTKSHEYVFLLSKSKKYYYDHVAIMQDVTISTISRLSQDVENQNGSDRVPGKTNGTMKAKASWNGSSFDKGKKTGVMKHSRGGRSSGNKERKDRPGAPEGTGKHQKGSVPWEGMKANKRSVWSITTTQFKEAHFATFPEELPHTCISAGSKEGDLIMDPFMGGGTTALVARKLNRNFIGIELNPEYVRIAEKRLKKELGLFI